LDFPIGAYAWIGERVQMDEFMPMTKTAKGTAAVMSTMAPAKKLSLHKESNDRFSIPCPDSKMEETVRGKWCINTQRRTAWAV